MTTADIELDLQSRLPGLMLLLLPPYGIVSGETRSIDMACGEPDPVPIDPLRAGELFLRL